MPRGWSTEADTAITPIEIMPPKPMPSQATKRLTMRSFSDHFSSTAPEA